MIFSLFSLAKHAFFSSMLIAIVLLQTTGCSSDSSSSQPAQPPPVSPTPTPTPVPQAGVYSSSEADHTCATNSAGRVTCWGRNDDGQLGLGDTANRGDGAGEMGSSLTAVSLGTNRKAIAISGGSRHSCAILDNGAVKCWGRNDSGQLGLGDTDSRGDELGEMGDALGAVNLGTGRTAKALTGGTSHTCAILDNDSVKCWGKNSAGQLGLGDMDDRGDGAGEMGDALGTVNLGTGRTAKRLVSGSGHNCAILDNNSVKCWGLNTAGQLGLGDTDDRGNNAGEMGDSLPSVNLGTGRTAKDLAAGATHTCAILDDDSVKCWGTNLFGQLGIGDGTDRGNNAADMGNSLPTVSLGAGRSAKTLSLGWLHSCALLDDNLVKCWGANSDGQLGLGDTSNRGDGVGEMGDSLPTVNLGSGRSVKKLTLGANHGCALLDNDTLKCWGFNMSGQLGLGDTSGRGSAGGQMGDSLPAVDVDLN